jgi:hypothetical protein
MATINDVKSLAVKDSSFRKDLFTNPESALKVRLKLDISKLTSSMTAKELDKFFADRESALGW